MNLWLTDAAPDTGAVKTLRRESAAPEKGWRITPQRSRLLYAVPSSLKVAQPQSPAGGLFALGSGLFVLFMSGLFLFMRDLFVLGSASFTSMSEPLD
ncbi:MAG: hypothetical protein LBP19_06085 [Treponema sp.]|jgi:hypothetical protein|nr:hypothetical protein [Treponema sp.]